MLLELLCSQVGHDQCHDVADDGGEVAPQQALVHDKVGHSTDEGKVPVVPQVYVNGACTLREQHQEVHTQTDRDNERTDSRTIGHSGSSRPAHVKDTQLQVVKFRNLTERVTEIIGQQSRYDAKTDEADAHVETALERLAEFHADAQTNNSKEDGHHHRCAQTDNVTEYLFHFIVLVVLA